jgi:integrase
MAARHRILLIEARRSGRLRPQKSAEPKGVGMATIRHDLVALNTGLNWAVGYRDARGRRLLTANPLTGIALPREVSPKRPVAGEERYLALKAVADQLNSRFGLALDLAYATGHRIGAILHLKWEDVSFAAQVHAPFGTISWRAEHDKIENEHTTPMSQIAHEALRRAQRERPAIGGAWIFGSDADPGKPTDRHTAKRWLHRAEVLAKLTHEKGGGWHAFRRGWATRRKHLPLKDVAAAGGWKDTESLVKCYQHADPETMFRVVSEPVTGGRVIPEPIPVAQNDKGPNRVSAIGALS